jgi:hypothetical protein
MVDRLTAPAAAAAAAAVAAVAAAAAAAVVVAAINSKHLQQASIELRPASSPRLARLTPRLASCSRGLGGRFLMCCQLLMTRLFKKASFVRGIPQWLCRLEPADEAVFSFEHPPLR